MLHVRYRTLLLAAPLTLANADPVPIPVEVKAMLDAAIASGNEGEIATIVKYARAAQLPSADTVAQIAEGWSKERAEAANRRKREAHFLDLVKGRAELGGYMTTGNSDNIGVTGVIDLRREGFDWRHKLKLQVDYQESQGLVSRERYFAAYEPNFKVDDRLYLYGAAQYESDRFLGYYDRLSGSVGAGYSAIKTPKMNLDIELGPAFRHTSFTDDTIENQLAARGSLNFRWQMTDTLRFRQEGSIYAQDLNSTIASLSALNAKLYGPLSAQLSYAVQYESRPPVGRTNTDTTSRAALVYEF